MRRYLAGAVVRWFFLFWLRSHLLSFIPRHSTHYHRYRHIHIMAYSSSLLVSLGLLSLLASNNPFTSSFSLSGHHSGRLFRLVSFPSPPTSSTHHYHHVHCRRPTRAFSHIVALPSSSSSRSSSGDTPVTITITTLITCTIDRITNNVIMSSSSPPTLLTYEILSEQNATTTNAIIEHYTSPPSSSPNDNTSASSFLRLSESEGASILRRDDEDGSKLQKGIDVAKDKGVLDPNFVPEKYITIDVLGKSPEDVANEILQFVKEDGGVGSGGGVVVLCGLSGTGKVRKY
jgi:hypothetical protein